MVDSNLRAFILAGGKGTRMREDERSLPKYLRDIGSESLLERQIRQLSEFGFSSATVLVNDRKQMIIDRLPQLQHIMPVSIAEDSNLTGTGGAILSALGVEGENFLVIYSDTVFNLDIQKLIDFHREKNSDFTTVVHPNSHPWDSDRVVVDESNRVQEIIKKGEPNPQEVPNLCLAGMLIIKKSFLQEILNELMPGRELHLDVVGDFLTAERLISARVFGFRSSDYIKDAGTPERFENVGKDLTRNFALSSQRRPTVFLDRDGTVIVHKDLLSKSEEVELIPGVGNFIRTLNDHGILALIVTNQSVIARGLCTKMELSQIHNRMENLLAKNSAFIDQIYYCPHHPDSGYEGEVAELKINCECRKPNTGLLMQAQSDHKIDLTKVFYVGDTEIDALTAENFGAQYFQVRYLEESPNATVGQYELIFKQIEELI
jgi:mannose-1-phosphate guanylyltransferase/phosphomannomutase